MLNYSGERLKIKIVENLGTVSVNNDGFWGHLKVGDSYLKIGEKLVDKDNEWVCEFRAVNSAKELIWRYGTVKYIDIKGDDVLVVWKQESFDNFTKEK